MIRIDRSDDQPSCNGRNVSAPLREEPVIWRVGASLLIAMIILRSPCQAGSGWRPDHHCNGVAGRTPLVPFQGAKTESCPKMPSLRHVRSSDGGVSMYADYRSASAANRG